MPARSENPRPGLRRGLAAALAALALLLVASGPAALAGSRAPLRVENRSSVPITVRVLRRGPDRQLLGESLPDSGAVISDETVGYVPPGGVRYFEGALATGRNEVVIEPQADEQLPERRTVVSIDGKGRPARGGDVSISVVNRDFGIDDGKRGRLPETPDVVDLHQARQLIDQLRALAARAESARADLNCTLAPHDVPRLIQDADALRQLVKASRADLPRPSPDRAARIESLREAVFAAIRTAGTERRKAASARTETEKLSGKVCARAREIAAIEPPDGRRDALPDLVAMVADTAQADRRTATHATASRAAASEAAARLSELRRVVLAPDSASRPDEAVFQRQIASYRRELDALARQTESAAAIARRNREIDYRLYDYTQDSYTLLKEVWRALGETGEHHYQAGSTSFARNAEAVGLWREARELDAKIGEANSASGACVGGPGDMTDTGRIFTELRPAVENARVELEQLEKDARLGHSTGQYGAFFFQAVEKWVARAGEIAGGAEKDSALADGALAGAEKCLAEARRAAEPPKTAGSGVGDPAVADGQAALRSCEAAAIRQSRATLSRLRDRLDPGGLRVLDALVREDEARRSYERAKARFEGAADLGALDAAARVLDEARRGQCPSLRQAVVALDRAIRAVRAAVERATQAMASCDVGAMTAAEGALAGNGHPLVAAKRRRLVAVRGHVTAAASGIEEAVGRYRQGFLRQAANLLQQARGSLAQAAPDAACPKLEKRIANGLRKIKWIEIFVARSDRAIAACDLPAVDALIALSEGKSHRIIDRKRDQLRQARKDCAGKEGEDRIADTLQACKAKYGRGATVWFDSAEQRYKCKCGEGFARTRDGQGCIEIADLTRIGDRFCQSRMPGSRVVRPVDPARDFACECVPPLYPHPFGLPVCQTLIQTAQAWCAAQRPGWVAVAVRGWMDYSCCPAGSTFNPAQGTCTTNRPPPTRRPPTPTGIEPLIPLIPLIVGAGAGGGSSGGGGGGGGGSGSGNKCHRKPGGGWHCGSN